MAALAGLPIPRMDWSSTNAPQALKKFKSFCQLYFAGPLKDKSEEEQPLNMVRRRRNRTGFHVVANNRRKEKAQHILGKVRGLRGAEKQLQACTLQTPHPEAGSWRISRFIPKESTDFSKRVQVHKPR